MNKLDANHDQALRKRALRVIPGGMWGHQNAARLPAGYPQFFKTAEGCRITDVDGREYIDFMCAWGPMLLGYNDADVERAAETQRRLGDSLNGPTERLVELAELVVDIVPHADWATFQKNGTDATTTCVVIARAHTGRRKILIAEHAYHGAVPWCNPYPVGSLPEDRAHILRYAYNDASSLEAAAAAAGDDLAGVLVSGFQHDYGAAHALPTAEFAAVARRICDRTSALLVVDDVRAGCRINIGGSWEVVGVQPDLAAWSKAIANGRALAMVTGSDVCRESAGQVFATGSFWTAGEAMAAGIATLTKLRDTDGIGRMRVMGQRLRDGLDEQARTHGLPLVQSGPPQMPVMLFDGDTPERQMGWTFCTEALKRGVYLHAAHTMFLSAAHCEADIDQALEATDGAMAETARVLG